MSASGHVILCMTSYYKGNRFLMRCKQEGAHVILLTVEQMLKEDWPRDHLDEVLAVPSFEDRRQMINAVGYLFRTRRIDRIVSLDDYDVELISALREHFRLPGIGDSGARLFRDKLAMRTQARECGIVQPPFTPLFNNGAVKEFMAEHPGPWLMKPRSEASAIGIKKMPTPDDVWRRLDELGDDRSFHLLEKMIPGDLYHVDSIVANHEVAFAFASQYARPLLEVYHGGGVYATRTIDQTSPEAKALCQANEQVLTGFGMDFCASHTEFMRNPADGKCYFIETSCRVGGANTAEMVEAAFGVNLWSEWAKVELDRDKPYKVPPLTNKFAGTIVSLTRYDWPDYSPFNAPEVVYRMKKKSHIGLVVCCDGPERVEALLTDYQQRIAQDYLAVLPAADKATA
jgi:hypothetical protein